MQVQIAFELAADTARTEAEKADKRVEQIKIANDAAAAKKEEQDVA